MARDRFFIRKRSKKPVVDEEIISEDSENEQLGNNLIENDSDGEALEDSNDKRLRLAKEYLEKLQSQQDEFSSGAKQADDEIISSRLRNEQLEQTGRLCRDLTGLFSSQQHQAAILKSHSKPITQAVLTPNGRFLYTAGKDGLIIKWDVKTLKKLFTFEPFRTKRRISPKQNSNHTNEIFALAVSSDSRFLASGGADRKVNVYSIEEDVLLKSLYHHQAAVTGLVFRRNSSELFSASMDRTVKLWNVEALTYVETLFGHQEGILDADSLVKERVISVAGRDRSLHLFKILDESQLVFRVEDGRFGALNCCKMIDEEHFVCATDCGSLVVFSISRKKPVFILANAHSDGSSICSLGRIVFSNILISASSSGNVRVWQIGEKKESLSLIKEILVDGFPNCISTSYDGSLLAIACGKEPRLGRWDKRSDFINATYVFHLCTEC